uniref:Uncharacterized protein n=2 Tax=Populus TaxID=3689 RepID=A0A4V6A9U6_POPAL|nr:hypothetical protein D5086_0000102960 [Populus alba]
MTRGEAEIKGADGTAAGKLVLNCRWRVSTRLLRRTVAYRGCADLWRIVIVAGWRRNLGQSAGGSRCFNAEKEVTVQMERSTVVLRSAWLDLHEIRRKLLAVKIFHRYSRCRNHCCYYEMA